MYAFGSVIEVAMKASSGCPAFAADSFRLSRSGPTLPFAPAGLKVWHAEQPDCVNHSLPAAASPAAFVGVVVVPVPVAASLDGFSRPNTSTADIIARKNATQTTR